MTQRPPWEDFNGLHSSAVRKWAAEQSHEHLELIAVNLLCALGQGHVMTTLHGFEHEEGWFRSRNMMYDDSEYPPHAPLWSCLDKAYMELFGLDVKRGARAVQGERTAHPALQLIDFNELDDNERQQ